METMKAHNSKSKFHSILTHQLKRLKLVHFQLLLSLVLLSSIEVSAQRITSSYAPPAPPVEFRGVWVATVSNIDWPSKPGLSNAKMKEELRELVTHVHKSGFNAVIFQVRPSCEVIYPSKLEPWSEVLTGKCGQAPENGFDPLKYAIELTHNYGLEFHAWINPFRARHRSAKSKIPGNHISKRHPKIVKDYGGYLWLDPGTRIAQEHTLAVAKEIISNYDVDGIHIDDYFYPYAVKKKDGSLLEFPDWSTYSEYKKSGGKLSHSNWRRACINQFVRSLYQTIHAQKPGLKVGISPFGIWRPNNPPGIKGKDSYLELYADSRKWLQQGWLDYMAPQLYWPIKSSGQPFEPLLNWWIDQNKLDRHIYPGINLSRFGTGSWNFNEINNQIIMARKTPGSLGHIQFSAKYLLDSHNSKSGSQFQKSPHRSPALVPQMKWKKKRFASPPESPLSFFKTSRNNRIGWQINWTDSKGKSSWRAFNWLVQTRINGTWSTTILPGGAKGFFLPNGPQKPEVVSVRSVSRDQILSRPKTIVF